VKPNNCLNNLSPYAESLSGEVPFADSEAKAKHLGYRHLEEFGVTLSERLLGEASKSHSEMQRDVTPRLKTRQLRI